MEHMIETAKSGRAGCRGCKDKIAKGDLRFGEQYESDFGSGVRWYHLSCAAKRVPKLLEDALEGFEGDIPNRDELDQLMKEGAKKKAKTERAFPYAELAPSGRSKCMQCDEKIEKDTYRVAVEREIDTGSFVTKGAGYLHPGCAEDHGDIDWAAVEENSDLEGEALEAFRAARA